MSKFLFVFTLFLFFIVKIQAQDPIFSQYYNTRVFLNPAYTGLEHGLTFSAAARNQYGNLNSQFYTTFVAAELQEPSLRSGFGISASRQAIGEGAFSTQNLNLSYAYILPLSGAAQQNVHNISLGLRAGLLQRSLDWSKLRFLDQLDATQGVISGTSAVPIQQNTLSFDAQAGILWRSELQIAGKKTLNCLGLTISHLTGKETGFTGFIADSPLRLTIHGATAIPIHAWSYGKHSIAFAPALRAELQSNLSLLSYSLYFLYDDMHVGASFQSQSIGALPSNANSWILMAAIKIPMSSDTDHSLFLGYSFENRLSNFSSLFGNAHEITLRYNFGDAQIFRRETPTFKGKLIAAKGLF